MDPDRSHQDDAVSAEDGAAKPEAPAAASRDRPRAIDTAGVEASREVTAQAPRDLPDAVRLLIPLGTALIIGIFVALGLEGDTRSRFIRNQPESVFLGFALVIVGLALPILFNFPSRKRGTASRSAVMLGGMTPYVGVLGGVLVLAGALLAFWYGAASFEEREQPTLSAVATATDEGGEVVEVKVSSVGLSLKSNERMLLRVAAFSPELVTLAAQDPQDNGAMLTRPCWDTGGPGTELRDLTEQERNLPMGSEPARALYWGETGPSSTGTASTSVTVTVPLDTFSHLCAYAALTRRSPRDATPVPDPDNDRYSRLILDLRNADKAGTSATPTLTADKG